jgi:site-specific DNA-methyltransferase (adenine-specific)
MAELGHKIDLIYLDPPYATGGNMYTREGTFAYRDTYSIPELVDNLTQCIKDVPAILADCGTFYLHMDWRAVHDMKIACDRIFGGSDSFMGSIAWLPGNGAKGKRFRTTHQTLLLYTHNRKKTVFHYENPLLRVPYSETSLKMHFTKTDENGRRYRERVVNNTTYRYYADSGRNMESIWDSDNAMAANTPFSEESTGYPTQKPMSLLNRIVAASSVEGEVVADFMCGSGTTLIAAAKANRYFVGCDQSEIAIETTKKRLVDHGIAYTHIG